jgi:hypothetical protein
MLTSGPTPRANVQAGRSVVKEGEWQPLDALPYGPYLNSYLIYP